MKFGYRDRERFWITIIVRMAFGFLFLIAAVNIFNYYEKKAPPPDTAKFTFFQQSLKNYADDLSRPYESSWINFKWPWWPAETNKEAGAVEAMDLGIKLVWYFLYAMPFVFSLLSICLLTGFMARPAMRLSAIYMVLLGLGKYLSGDSVTTAQDFLYAAFLCLGLYVASEDKQVRAEEEAEENQEARTV